MRWLFQAGLLLFFSVSLRAAEPLKCPEPVTRIALAEGQYSPQPGTVFALHDFQANMVARGKSMPLCFARTTEILRGEVFVSSADLGRMFQRKVKQSDSSISDVTIETQPDKVVLKGKVTKLIPIPFTVEGPVTTDGRNLDLHATSVKALGIPVKGLLDALGKELDGIIQSESVNGVSANGDTLVFKPKGISHVDGHIEQVQITKKGLLVRFGEKTGGKTNKMEAKLLHH